MSTVAEIGITAEQLVLPAMDALGDDALMQLQESIAAVRRRVDAAGATVAAEIARRSSRNLGYGGLAQRVGARTPEKLVQRLTGSSIRDARTLVEIGRILAPTPTTDDDGPVVESVLAEAIRTGSLTLDQVRAITVGLGSATNAIPESDLDPARRELVDLARSGSTSVEELRAHARVLRDELDTAGVADRENALRGQRYLRLFPQDDGMTRVAGLLDPESASRLHAVVDAALSPRRGGPRFVDEEDRERAERLASDPRSNDQIALDTVIALLESGVHADTASGGALLGRNGAPVQILVTARDLSEGTGFARLGGQTVAVSIATAERRICSDGAAFIQFDRKGTEVLRLGCRRRRFSAAQRMALTARDGCCRRCGRSASQTEAHHIVPWSHGGPTDLDNALLLCRFCHMLVHNNGWGIDRDAAGEIWFVPPPDVDALRRRVAAHPRNPILRRLAG